MSGLWAPLGADCGVPFAAAATAANDFFAPHLRQVFCASQLQDAHSLHVHYSNWAASLLLRPLSLELDRCFDWCTGCIPELI